MTRVRGRRRVDRSRRGAGLSVLPWRRLHNPYPPVEVLDEEGVERIHAASLRVLSEAGLTVSDPEARSIYGRAGAEVDGETVRFDPALVEALVAEAPAEFEIAARNPERSVAVGGRNVNFCAVGGPSFVSDLDRGRRPGTYAELCDFKRLIHSLGIIHMTSVSSFAAMDNPPETRHLDDYLAAARLTDRVWSGWLLGRGRARDAIEMASIVHGLSPDEVVDRPVVYGNINTNSPRLLDGPMAQGLIEFARFGQPVVVTPFTLAGAMAPATVAGALVQQNAEALAGIALTQAVRPGTPVVYGGFTSNVDLRTGAPAFGTPEQTQAAQATGQLCRRYGLPFRSSSTTASAAVDAQATYESQMSLWGAVMGHANLVFHAGGWLEGGLVGSFEKLILDAEILQLIAGYLRPFPVNDDTLAVAAIEEVGAGQHFLGHAHTLARYETAFYQPLLSDWRNYETWAEDGGRTATERANLVWKRLLREYEEPRLDPAVDEALSEFVARRKADIAREGIEER